MKTKILSFILSVVVCIGLSSCSDDTWAPKGVSNAEGSVSLASMKVDVDDNADVISRATISTDAFIVNILDKTSGEIIRSYKYGTMPEVLTLPVGEYTVDVKSHEVQEAEFDAPYYIGSADFSVELGKITEIGTVFCKFSNIKVTIKYTNELLSYVGNDAKVTVRANDRGELDFSTTETRSGYFAAIEGSTTLVAIFSATINGNQVDAIQTFTDVAPGKHYIITFSVKNGSTTIPDETGLITPSGIKVDANITSENISGTAPVDGETQQPVKRPGDEEWPDDNTDPVNPNKPNKPDQPNTGNESGVYMTLSDGLDADGINDIKDGQEYEITFDTETPITGLRVTINSPYLTQEFMEGIDMDTELDLVNPGDLEEGLVNFGLPVNDEVKGHTNLTVNLSALIPLLNIYGYGDEGKSGVHKFILTVNTEGKPDFVQTLQFRNLK